MTDPVKIIVGEGDITEVNVPEYGIIQTGGGGGGGGSDGATFFPEVSQEGVISWTNDGGYDNPDPVNIKGPAGNDGSDGEDGDDGTTFTPAVDASGNLSWTNDGGKQNPQTVNIKGPQGDAGQGVPAGGTTGQVLAKASNADYVTEWVDQSGGGGGTSDYDDLTDKPSINNVTLSGNKTAADLSLGTYSKPSTGIPQTDLAQAVQNKLDKTVVVSDTQPTETENKLWVDTDAGAGTSYQVPTVAEMEAADAQTAAEIGIVITGKRPSRAVTAGQYVIVRNSTISGITDGLYTANAALSPSTDVTAANLTAVSGGGLNDLKRIANYNPTMIATGVTLLGRSLMTVYGEFFFFRAVVQVTTAQIQDAELFQLPNYNYDTTTTANVLVSRVDGGNGYTTVSIAANNIIRVVLPGGMATGRYEILLFGKCT